MRHVTRLPASVSRAAAPQELGVRNVGAPSAPPHGRTSPSAAARPATRRRASAAARPATHFWAARASVLLRPAWVDAASRHLQYCQSPNTRSVMVASSKSENLATALTTTPHRSLHRRTHSHGRPTNVLGVSPFAKPKAVKNCPAFVAWAGPTLHAAYEACFSSILGSANGDQKRSCFGKRNRPTSRTENGPPSGSDYGHGSEAAPPFTRPCHTRWARQPKNLTRKRPLKAVPDGTPKEVRKRTRKWHPGLL